MIYSNLTSEQTTNLFFSWVAIPNMTAISIFILHSTQWCQLESEEPKGVSSKWTTIVLTKFFPTHRLSTVIYIFCIFLLIFFIPSLFILVVRKRKIIQHFLFYLCTCWCFSYNICQASVTFPLNFDFFFKFLYPSKKLNSSSISIFHLFSSYVSDLFFFLLISLSFSLHFQFNLFPIYPFPIILIFLCFVFIFLLLFSVFSSIHSLLSIWLSSGLLNGLILWLVNLSTVILCQKERELCSMYIFCGVLS